MALELLSLFSHDLYASLPCLVADKVSVHE